jgi:S1-C subfamily serine protease
MPATTDHGLNQRAPWPGPDDWVYPESPPTAPPAGGPPHVPPTPPTGFDGQPFAPGPAPVDRSNNRSAWVVLAAVAMVVAFVVGIVAFESGRTFFSTADAPSASSAAGPGPLSQPNRQTNPGGNSGGGSSANGQSSTPQNWTQVAAAIDPGVVNIETRLPQGIGAGTGMVLSDSGEILTNNHVIDGATQIAVSVSTTGDVYDATVVGTDPSDDIAVLKLTGASGLATIPLGDSDSVKVGDSVAAIGNAGGKGGEPSVAPGTVSALHQQITASDQNGSNAQTLTDMIQVDANVQPGDSGGPLVDANAKVVGIDAAASSSGSRYQTADHEGFAIPINRALKIAKSIEANPNASSGSGSQSATSGGYLGVQVDPTSSARGAAVVGVQSNSPAKSVGLAAGDVITAIDNTKITSADALTTAMQSYAGGDSVQITWQASDGTSHHSTVTLASR